MVLAFDFETKWGSRSLMRLVVFKKSDSDDDDDDDEWKLEDVFGCSCAITWSLMSGVGFDRCFDFRYSRRLLGRCRSKEAEVRELGWASNARGVLMRNARAVIGQWGEILVLVDFDHMVGGEEDVLLVGFFCSLLLRIRDFVHSTKRP